MDCMSSNVESLLPLNISARLRCDEELLPPSSFLIDIGTDHAKLPISLLHRGIVSKAWGVDVNRAPLNRAALNARPYSFAKEQFRCVLSDGFSQLKFTQKASVSMADMGGRQMIRILSSQGDLPVEYLVLQPNGKEDELRSWLWNRGWLTENETIIKERNRFYVTMLFSKTQGTVGGEYEARYGPILLKNRPSIWEEWLEQELRMLLKARKRAGSSFSDRKNKIILEIQTILN